ncbi:thiamine phosphate synthase [Motiliproteus sp. MSK22-1]|uniref:thiamine phosphate synthase n=1 Tax=Motiliproteus sp. MSK22-1 TaxID=1897630 RepID=UPI000976657F|nr:thiamine phosphate synthase [Motiliproteus sp. MSK22-1]OMH32191.1 thiamine-phosphate diphosphorylase [Motiliproteus sp. MSK22-1]
MTTTCKSPLAGLYGITDAQLMPEDVLFHKVEQALQGGATLIQYRDKSKDSIKRLSQARRLVQICRQYNRPLLINDDIDLAIEASASGVHLGQQDGSVEEARRELGTDSIIGVTCHNSLDLSLQAQDEGANYVAFGAFFPSSTKPNAKPASIELLHDARQQLQIPIVAIGGIRVDNADQLIKAGAHMLAVVHSLFAADNVKARAQQYTHIFSQ